MENADEKSFLRQLADELFSTEIKNLASIIIVLLIVGMVFYNQIEHWGWVDSLYFSITTLTTVGYGDLAPTTTISKLFTTGYILVGLGTVLTFLQTIARQQAKESIIQKLVRYHSNKKPSEVIHKQKLDQ